MTTFLKNRQKNAEIYLKYRQIPAEIYTFFNIKCLIRVLYVKKLSPLGWLN